MMKEENKKKLRQMFRFRQMIQTKKVRKFLDLDKW